MLTGTKEDDIKHLTRSVELADESVKLGNHPFGVSTLDISAFEPASLFYEQFVEEERHGALAGRFLFFFLLLRFHLRTSTHGGPARWA